MPLRQSFGAAKLSNNRRAAFKTRGCSRRLLSRDLNQSSIKEKESSSLFSARESQVCKHFRSKHIQRLIYLTNCANLQVTALGSTTTSLFPQLEEHMMSMRTEEIHNTLIMKDKSEELEEKVDESCIFCGTDPKEGRVHLQLLHQIQVLNAKKTYLSALELGDMS